MLHVFLIHFHVFFTCVTLRKKINIKLLEKGQPFSSLVMVMFCLNLLDLQYKLIE